MSKFVMFKSTTHWFKSPPNSKKQTFRYNELCVRQTAMTLTSGVNILAAV